MGASTTLRSFTMHKTMSFKLGCHSSSANKKRSILSNRNLLGNARQIWIRSPRLFKYLASPPGKCLSRVGTHYGSHRPASSPFLQASRRIISPVIENTGQLLFFWFAHALGCGRCAPLSIHYALDQVADEAVVVEVLVDVA
jgi:hypothetical protein